SRLHRRLSLWTSSTSSRTRKGVEGCLDDPPEARRAPVSPGHGPTGDHWNNWCREALAHRPDGSRSGGPPTLPRHANPGGAPRNLATFAPEAIPANDGKILTRAALARAQE